MIINFDGKMKLSPGFVYQPAALPPAKKKLNRQLDKVEIELPFLFALKRYFCFHQQKVQFTKEVIFNMADLKDFFDKCNEVFHLSSKIPKEAREEDCILGIDEAGRGPVLGKRVEISKKNLIALTNVFSIFP